MVPVNCDLCGSDRQEVLFNRGRNRESVSNVICLKCGLVYVSPRPSQADLSNQYASGAFSESARGSMQPTKAKFGQSERVALRRFRHLASLIDMPARVGARCLEIGCGLGSFLRLMKGAGWQVLGLEPDAAYAQAGSETYRLSIVPRAYEDAGTEWREQHDLIAAFHVLEHVYSPRAFLEKAFGELAPDGLLYLELPCIERPYGGNLERFFWSSHLTTFSARTLRGMLQHCGFALVSDGYVGDFLWVLARKRPGGSESVTYPLDEPARRKKVTLAAYRRFNAGRMMPVARLLRLGQTTWARVRAQEDWQDELVSGLVRKGRRWLVETPGPAKARSGLTRLRGHYVAHFGMHVPGNAGDTLLFEAVRKSLSYDKGQVLWSLEPLWPEVTETTVNRLNREAKAIVVGGGGLLLRDTNPNSNSGWQWNVSAQRLRDLDVPIIVYAIGYNRFRDQAEFDPVFHESVSTLVERSAFIGLRNEGSISALASYLTPGLAGRLRYQPCPTTVLRYLYPRFAGDAFRSSEKRLALNIAFDRHQHRFGNDEDAILLAIAQAMKWASTDGWQIDLVVHSGGDANVIPWLVRERVPFREVHLNGRPASRILHYYQAVPLTIGMRGHSQMIPFGLGNGIISLISHDKLAYFLSDIGHPEWGIDVTEMELADRLRDRIERFDGHREQILYETAQAQQRLWQITKDNTMLISKLWSR